MPSGRTSLSLAVLVLSIFGCSEANPNSAKVADAARTQGGDRGRSASDACADCAASEACLSATVRAHAEPSQLPWVKWPMVADGAGTLVTSVRTDRVVQRTQTADADFSEPDASAMIHLGCVPSSTELIVTAFLDDNGNAGGASSSTDQADACMGGQVPEAIRVALEPGESRSVTLVLAISCNSESD